MYSGIDGSGKGAKFDPAFMQAANLLDGESSVIDNIFSSLGDGLSIQDKEMRIVYQNKFMIDNFGAHVGEPCYKIYEERDAICDGCPVIEAFETEEPCKALRVGVTRDGEEYRFEITASVLRNYDGEIIAGMELVRSVEDRERALDELKIAMEQLILAKSVYECSSEGIMVVDKDNRIISTNHAFERITGYSFDDVAGTNPSILSSGRHEPAFFADMWRTLQKRGSWQGEIWNKRKDGQVYRQHTHIDTILNEDGEVSKRVCVFYDATEKECLNDESLL